MSTYTGMTAENMNGSIPNRYFYGLRRTDHGELFIGQADQMKIDD